MEESARGARSGADAGVYAAEDTEFTEKVLWNARLHRLMKEGLAFSGSAEDQLGFA